MITAFGIIVAGANTAATLLIVGYMWILSRAAERPYAGPPAVAIVASLALSVVGLFFPVVLMFAALALALVAGVVSEARRK